MTRDNDVIWFMLGAKGPGAHVWAFLVGRMIPGNVRHWRFGLGIIRLTNSRRFMSLGRKSLYSVMMNSHLGVRKKVVRVYSTRNARICAY